MLIAQWALGPLVFSSAGMLLLGAAALAPILIHLLSRRRYEVTPWAAMEHLLAAMRKHSRRIRIEQLLLLAVRTLIVLLLALALSDAACNWSGTLGNRLAARGTRHTVLVIDGSYSMAYRHADGERFEQARRLATELVEAGTQGDGYTLVLLADPPRVIIGEPAFDARDVIAELDLLRITHGGARLSAALAEVEGILESVRRSHPRLTQHRAVFFTDLGRTTWAEAVTPGGAARMKALAQQAQLIVADVGEPATENLGVVQIEQSPTLLTAQAEAVFRAQIKNFGSQPSGPIPVELYLDDRRVGETTVELAAGEETTVAFAYRLEAPGEYVVEVRLPDDPLPVDNQRWISLQVREAIRVLCIAGRYGAARYVELALAPGEGRLSHIRPETASEIALLERDLHEYDCIFLCNVGRFGRDEAAVLHNYLRGGGGLVVFLGDQVNPEAYNAELAGEGGGDRVLPARLLGPSQEAQYRFDPRDYRHPIVAPFRGHEQTGLLTTPVWKYIRLQPFAEDGAVTALWFDGGDPAIVEQRIQRGRSILVATAADDSLDPSVDPPAPWTAMSAWPSFVPLVQEMLAAAIAGRVHQQNLLVGEPIAASIRSVSANMPVSLRLPDGRIERVRMTIDGEDSRWTFADTLLSGVYRAEYAPPPTPARSFAVNVDPRESDLSRMDPEELPEVVQRPSEDAAAAAALAASEGGGWRLFRIALALVLALVWAETIMAWRFGSGAG